MLEHLRPKKPYVDICFTKSSISSFPKFNLLVETKLDGAIATYAKFKEGFDNCFLVDCI